MARAPGLTLRQSQRLALTPTMRGQLAILGLSAEALAEELARAAAENPFLTLRPPRGTPTAYEIALADTTAPVPLSESLAAQIGLQRLARPVAAAAQLLIAELREDGYLDTPLPDLAARHGIDPAVLQDALAAVQRCDPPGIGARDLAECLTLQLADLGIDRALAAEAVAHLPLFAAGNWARLATLLSRPLPEVQAIAGLLDRVSPSPVQPSPAPAPIRLPEIAIDPRPDGTLAVRRHPDCLPRISFNRQLAAGAEPGSALGAAQDRARDLIAALRLRGATLLRIGHHIAARQAQFFVRGGASLFPETQAEAAAALSLHPSTLSRAIAGKALECEGRVYPLSLFFQRAVPAGAGALSAFDVQRRIRALISAEPEEAPLSDAHIAGRLQEEGVDIARRTVAKYRKCMRIAPSSSRRRRRRTGLS